MLKSKQTGTQDTCYIPLREFKRTKIITRTRKLRKPKRKNKNWNELARKRGIILG